MLITFAHLVNNMQSSWSQITQQLQISTALITFGNKKVQLGRMKQNRQVIRSWNFADSPDIDQVPLVSIPSSVDTDVLNIYCIGSVKQWSCCIRMLCKHSRLKQCSILKTMTQWLYLGYVERTNPFRSI